MKIQDLEQFQQPIKIELGKVDLFEHGQKHNRVVLEFNLFSGKGTHRASGEEYCAWTCIVYKAHGRSFWFTTDMPDYHLDRLIACGLNPLYRDYIAALRDTYRKNRKKAKIIVKKFGYLKKKYYLCSRFRKEQIYE